MLPSLQAIIILCDDKEINICFKKVHEDMSQIKANLSIIV